MLEVYQKWNTSRDCFLLLANKLNEKLHEGVSLEGNSIILHNKGLKGKIKFLELSNEMSLYKMELTVFEVLKFYKVTTELPEYYTILFSLNEGYDFHTFSKNLLEEEMEEIGLGGKRTVSYSSSDVLSLFKIIPADQSRFLLAIVSIAGVKKNIRARHEEAAWPDIFSNTPVNGYVTMDGLMIDEVSKPFIKEYPQFIEITYTKGLMYEILAMLAYEVAQKNKKIISGTGVAESARLVEIKNSLLDDFSRPCPSLNEMAERAHMSVTKFKTGFKKLFRMPYYQFYQHYRLMHAKKLLAAGSSIKDAAYEVGFSNAGHFTSTFKKKFNKLPSDFYNTPQ